MRALFTVSLATLLGLFAAGAVGPGAGAGEKPDDAELRCLAMNVYWESRSGSAEDQRAVAYVTLNRVASDGFPESICEVVRQGGEARDKCQFSWWCDGRPDRPTNPEAWRHALAAARQAVAGEYPDPTHGALFFHHDSVRPDWAARLTQTAAFGQHVFYK